jgi:cytochrome c peroxidase
MNLDASLRRLACALAPLLCLLPYFAPTAAAFEVAMQSRNGYYQAVLHTPGEVPPVAQTHSWTLTLQTRDGRAFVPGQLSLGGGMPAHGHGLPTEPRVTRHLGDGRFLIEGLRFNMSGRWQISISLSGPLGLDTLIAEFQVLPAAGPGAVTAGTGAASSWSEVQIAMLRTLRLRTLPEPADPSNALVGNAAAIDLGQALFFDPALSGSGSISCASCHEPARAFTDGRPVAVGSKTLTRNAPTLLGVAHWDWYYWDGRRDSLWAQALTPLETRGEMDTTRTDVVRYVLANPRYRHSIAQLTAAELTPLSEARYPTGAGPFADTRGKTDWQRMTAADRETVNRVFAALGKAIAAYEWTLRHSPSRFDRFADHLVGQADAADPDAALSPDEQAGLRLFLDPSRTQCLRCHNGPLFSNGGFHNIGSGSNVTGQPDLGRLLGLQAVWYDAFNCVGAYSDAPREACTHLNFAPRSEMPTSFHGAFKVPGLRNLSSTAPYFHDGRFDSLEAVVDYYRSPPDAASTGHELTELTLTDMEAEQLTAFLRAL